jgi:hypothetical protein
VLFASASLEGRAAELIDGRGASAGAPTVALIVTTPGYAPRAYEGLVAALEDRGVDAWLLVFSIQDQRLDGIVGHTIPEALSRFAGRDVGLVGHGIGGTLAALSLQDPLNELDPAAVALLGAPLWLPPSPLLAWLAARPPAPAGLDLRTLDARWAGHEALPLLLGAPLPPLEAVSGTLLEGLRAWAVEGLAVDLSSAFCPIWAGVGDHDNLGPPEAVRGRLPDRATFVRFGYLRGDPRDYDSAALLARPRPAAALAAWLRHALHPRAPRTGAPP